MLERSSAEAKQAELVSADLWTRLAGRAEGSRERLATGARLRRFASRLLAVVHLRLWVANILGRLLPHMVLPGVRCALYRWAGFRGIGRGVFIMGPVELRGLRGFERNLTIGEGTGVNSPCLFDLGGPISIGSGANLGHNVQLITTNHRLGPPSKRCGDFDFGAIEIGDGAWIGAGSLVLPGVVIGAGSVVVAGSVVARSVPAGAMVAGNPARVVRWIDGAPPAREPEGGS